MILERMFVRNVNAPKANSMGRLFDGVAALIDLCHVAEYEGHGPIMMEGLLKRDFTIAPAFDYCIEHSKEAPFVIDYRPLVRDLIVDICNKTAPDVISRRFHSTVVDFSVASCMKVKNDTGVSNVVLSGGVFYNQYLLVNVIRSLRANGFTVYFHQLVPPNDGDQMP